MIITWGEFSKNTTTDNVYVHFTRTYEEDGGRYSDALNFSDILMTSKSIEDNRTTWDESDIGREFALLFPSASIVRDTGSFSPPIIP